MSSSSEDHNEKMMIINSKSSQITNNDDHQKEIVSNNEVQSQEKPPTSSSALMNKEDSLKPSSVINTAATRSSSSSNMNTTTKIMKSDNLESLISNITLDNNRLNCSSGNGQEQLNPPPTSSSSLLNENDSNSNSTQESNIEDSNEESLMTVVATPGINKSETTQNSSNSSQEYHLKWIKWKGTNNKVPIVTQNSNGSCPLLAIINVLLLRKNISFPPIIEIVTASQLMDFLCECILTYVPKNLPEQVKLNYEQNLQDAMSIMPRLQTGLDVNVKFTGTMDFEYTPECIIFDLLRIPLYHGWLVDPDHKEIYRIVNNQSYNQLVDRIIESKTLSSNDSEMFLAEEFLNQSASQLTNYGLSQLIKHIKEEELCILFRNNHFITLFKHKGKLYQLVTDQGFLTEPNVVWESLNNIEGDTYFVDGDFVLVPPKPSLTLQSTPNINTQQQIDHDYLIALSLEQEQNYEVERTKSSNQQSNNELLQKQYASILMSDEELARKLQAEENQYYELQQKQRQHDLSKQTSSTSTTKKLYQMDAQGNCMIIDPNVRWHHTPQSTASTSGNNSVNVTATKSQHPVTTMALHHPHYHQHRHQTSRSSSSTDTVSLTQHSSGASSTTGSGNRSSSHHHTHPNYQSRSSTISEPTTTTNSEHDHESVSSRRSNNKNSCVIS